MNIPIKLSINESCHQNWDTMTPTQQGKFCNACAKVVIDFSVLTDTQVLNYFKNYNGENVCGRAFDDQLNVAIQEPKLTKKNNLWKWNYAATSLFLLLNKTTVKAQGLLQITKSNKNLTENCVAKKTNNSDTIKKLIVGQVVQNKEIHEKPLIVLDGKIVETLNAIKTTDLEEADILNASQAQALFGIQGKYGAAIFQTKQAIDAKRKTLDEVIVKTTIDIKRLSRSGAVSASILINNKSSILDSTKLAIKSILGNGLKLYPNPVQIGQQFTIYYQVKKAAVYQLQIINMVGQIMCRKEINLSTKNIEEQIQTNTNWSAGIFIVELFDDNNKLIGTSKMLIQ